MQEALYALLEKLVLLHAPSGDEREIDQFLLTYLHLFKPWQDEAGNVILHLPGQQSDQPIAITAHKDEIGMMVQQVEADGRLRLCRLGGTFPWIYGEGVVDILAHKQTISGILSFGARHVSHQSPQKAQQLEASLKWEHTWVETFLSLAQLSELGVQPGTRVVIGKHRKHPLRMGDRVASYALDNKAAIAVLLLLVEHLPLLKRDTYFIFSSQEEIGGLGALHFTHRRAISELIALEVTPIAPEYPLVFNDQPVLLSGDSYSCYDLGLNHRLTQAAQQCGVGLQQAVLSGFGSDASLVVKSGHVAQTACLGFPTLNTHGYEITHLSALLNLLKVLQTYLQPTA